MPRHTTMTHVRATVHVQSLAFLMFAIRETLDS
jgi:hypothetical protein